MKQYFLQLELTYNWTRPFKPIAEWPWITLNYTEEVGLKGLTTEDIAGLKTRLSLDETLTKRYLTKKVGYNPDDPEQVAKAMFIYEDFGILKKDLKTYSYICYMSKSIMVDEL